MAALRCPRCGESEADGAEFEMVWATRALYAGKAVTKGGVLQYPNDWSEIGFDRNRQSILRCDECGHSWTTNRKIEGI